MRHPPPEILGLMSPFLPLYPSYATERKREEAGSAGACYYHQPGAKLSLRRCRRRRRFFRSSRRWAFGREIETLRTARHNNHRHMTRAVQMQVSCNPSHQYCGRTAKLVSPDRRTESPYNLISSSAPRTSKPDPISCRTSRCSASYGS